MDNTRPMTDTNAVWHPVEVGELKHYFVMECCAPGDWDSIEEYEYETCKEMYYHHKAVVEDDKAIAADDGREYEPYNYPMFYVKLTFIEEKNGVKYYEEERNPIKVYKYRGLIQCKYV